MKVIIRQENSQDYSRVENLVESAFKEMKRSDQTEHLLVRRLRKSAAFLPQLSLVAELENELLGHILLTKIKIVNPSQSFDSLALSPVSVLPAYQRKGIGSALIREGHRIAKSLGFQSIVLLGHENYYPRFGYALAHLHQIDFPFKAPKENCMVLELVPDALKEVSGMVEYSPAFFD